LSWLIGGSAALLVGIGLGLQQTFNDLISGIIILIEGTVEVGDIVKIDESVAVVRKIGLRVSQIETRDNSTLIIPNSKLVVDNVNNLSHDIKPTRFQIDVGVGYNSDVRLVEKLLLQAANEHSRVSKKPKPRVQFRDFGNSSLDFTLHFHSQERMSVEFIKSDIRFNIIHLLRENKIEIPFPQQDLWLRNAESLRPPVEEPQETEKPELDEEV
jgi:small-conductance mechanosensitive channel